MTSSRPIRPRCSSRPRESTLCWADLRMSRRSAPGSRSPALSRRAASHQSPHQRFSLSTAIRRRSSPTASVSYLQKRAPTSRSCSRSTRWSGCGPRRRRACATRRPLRWRSTAGRGRGAAGVDAGQRNGVASRLARSAAPVNLREGPSPEYVEARRVLLDALEALGPHRAAVVLAGAQAVYLRTGPSSLAIAEHTTDGDLAVDPRLLEDAPL